MTTPDPRALAETIARHHIDPDRADRAQDADHCTCGPLVDDWPQHWAEVALEALAEHAWIVPKIAHDVNPHVAPLSRGGWIYRDAGQSDPTHTRQYAAQLLAAADLVESEGTPTAEATTAPKRPSMADALEAFYGPHPGSGW